jgi:hypothetical protein
MIGHLILHDPSIYPNININDADVVLFGVPRSATAMLFQLLQSLFPFGGVIYTHSYICPASSTWCVCAYRDFRACAVSHWRYVTQSLTTDQMSESNVRRFAGQMLGFITNLRYYRDHCNSTWIRYESHIGNPSLALNMLCTEYTSRTGQKVSDELQHRAEAYLCRKTQGELFSSSQIPSFQSNHIADGSNDGWRSSLSPPMIDLLTDILAEPLTEWGYSL